MVSGNRKVQQPWVLELGKEIRLQREQGEG